MIVTELKIFGDLKTLQDDIEFAENNKGVYMPPKSIKTVNYSRRSHLWYHELVIVHKRPY